MAWVDYWERGPSYTVETFADHLEVLSDEARARREEKSRDGAYRITGIRGEMTMPCGGKKGKKRKGK